MLDSHSPTDPHGAATSVDDHRARIDALLRTAFAEASETIDVANAMGRVVADPVLAPRDLPVFRNSQMDGFAVDAESIGTVPVTLDVLGTIAAGDAPSTPHVRGTARRIMTGAPIPDGADAVVPVEDTSAEEGDADRVVVGRARRAGEFVREQGSDIRRGDPLLGSGQVLAPRHLGALAAAGSSTVSVRRRPRVAVIATGAELVELGKPLGPGQIYDSNGLTLASSLIEDGADVVFRARSTDSPQEFGELLRSAVAQADAVITSGGVSMGDFEVVRDVLIPLGGEFGHVAMQPGGPQGLCVVDGTPILNFPGNPVSTLVSYVVFARSAVRRAAGLPERTSTAETLDHAVRSIPGKRQFLRGTRSDTGVVASKGPGSHLVATMASAQLLIDIAPEVTDLAAGDSVRVWEL